MNRRISKPKPALKWNRIFLVFFTIVLIVISLVILFRSSDNLIATDRSIAPPLVACDDYFESRKKWLLNHRKTKERFTKGKTFYDILGRYGLSAQDILCMDEACKQFFDLSQAQVGQTIDIWLHTKSETVEKICLYLSSEKILYITRNGQDFFPSLLSSSNITIPAVISGTVFSSLYQSALDSGIPSEVIMEIADIFAWDIDFVADIRPGDTFQVILEGYYRKGNRIGHGRVVAAKFVNRNTVHESFYFVDSRGGSGYYDRSGRSLRKAFLKSPLRYRRISSYFSSKRFHPILKIYRPHYGIDYAAPTGTPVESLGDGRVTFIGWKGGYGRYIKIRHNHIYETGYGHLSRFAKGLKKGSRLRQGEVIGYVGSSGLSTGPHLDFSMIKRGRFINPLKVESPPAVIVSKGDRERFNELVVQTEDVW